MISKKFKLTTPLLLLYVVFSCIFRYSYFAWETYPNRGISLIFTLLSYCGDISIIAIYLFSSPKISRIKLSVLFLLTLAVVLEFIADVLGYKSEGSLSFSDIRFFITIVIIFSLKDDIKGKMFKIFIYAFALACLPAMLYQILNMIGVSLPYSVLSSASINKTSRGMFYKHYPLGVIICEPWKSDRFCGIFDEPGVVGTFAAFFVAAGYKKVNKYLIALLIIEGMLSFSLAFYIMMIILLVVRAMQNGLIKTGATIIVLMIGFTIFMNMSFENSQLSSIQNRIDLSSRLLFVDNRTNSSFDNAFLNFIKEGGHPLLFGNGGIGSYELNQKMSGSCSYKCILYDFGIFGSLIFASFFATIILNNKITRKNFAFIMVFIASMYQRPYVYDVFHITLLCAALSFLKIDTQSSKNGSIRVGCLRIQQQNT